MNYKGYLPWSYYQNPKSNSIAADKTFTSFDFNNSGNTSICRISTAGAIKAFQLKNFYQTTLTLAALVLEQLQWWIKNIRLSMDWSLFLPPLQITIQTDASKTGWVSCQLSNHMRRLEQYGKDSTHQYSGIESNLFHPIDFTKEIKDGTVYLQIGNIYVLTYVLKMGNSDFRNDKDF